ncbi:MAG: hypothetical protein QM774_12405 [Gordonia sp. (in: high G+C Gram-positive bacteria)]|uniref:hypothetical protein n=1 Tax=Gordonia sp. (in: high G+C Gram-positive bacteria) TaxID=84139 RepID=UPI0039E25601
MSTTRTTLATVALAGMAGITLTACHPTEPIGHAQYTTPAVVTGDQAMPGEVLNSDSASDSDAQVATANLVDKDGNGAGAAGVVHNDQGTTLDIKLAGLKAGQYKAEVRSGGTCDPSDGFASTGAAVSGADVDGIAVAGDPATGAVSKTVNLDIDSLKGKSIVVLPAGDGGSPAACGVIVTG